MHDKKLLIGLTLNLLCVLTNSNIAKTQELKSNQIIVNQSSGIDDINNQFLTAPASGKMVTGTLTIPNPSVLDIDGPNISIDIENMNSKVVLEYIAEQGEYDLVFVKSNPTYAGNSRTNSNAITNINSESGEQAVYPLSSE